MKAGWGLTAEYTDDAEEQIYLGAGVRNLRLLLFVSIARTLGMNFLRLGWVVAFVLLLGGCATRDRDHVVLISVPEQKLTVLTRGAVTAEYPVSTSKYGLGDAPNSYRTPLGKMEVAQKFGGTVKSGTVFKNRQATREIVLPDAPGRDPIVTRILWLKGLETQNEDAFKRFIYIHGTPEERNIGRPASYGCIRMKSADVIEVFRVVGIGATVQVENRPTELMIAGAPVNGGPANTGTVGNSKRVLAAAGSSETER